jgi:hypothetical protein
MSVFTFAPMRATLPRPSIAVRPQKMVATMPSFTGMRMSKLMPAQIEGETGAPTARSLHGPGVGGMRGHVGPAHASPALLHRF